MILRLGVVNSVPEAANPMFNHLRGTLNLTCKCKPKLHIIDLLLLSIKVFNVSFILDIRIIDKKRLRLEENIKLIFTLRFGNSNRPSFTEPVHLSFGTIARLLNIPEHSIRKVCNEAITKGITNSQSHITNHAMSEQATLNAEI